MKIYWSAFLSLSLLLIAGCGKEQFGATPQSASSQADKLEVYNQSVCATKITTLKPMVDVLYVVDNSGSTTHIKDGIKAAIANTVSSVSAQFDYRIIGTSLISSSTNDFNVLTNSAESLGVNSGKKIISPSEFNFFDSTAAGSESGLNRVTTFINAHIADGLFRKDANLLIVLVSNGRDMSVEQQGKFGNSESYYVCNDTNKTQVTSQAKCADLTPPATSVFQERLAGFNAIKTTLTPAQMQFIAVTPHTNECNTGWFSAKKSYYLMGQELGSNYDLCKGMAKVFTEVNSTLKQIVIPHKYAYWPLDFPNNFDASKLKVYKVGSSGPVLMPEADWEYVSNSAGASIPTRIEPSLGEASKAKHLIKFAEGKEIVSPDCISVYSESNLEYFNHIIIPNQPQESTMIVMIKGQVIPKSKTNGWEYIAYQYDKNIKVAYNGYSDKPEVKKSGYMIKLNGEANYYQSGDSVEVHYLPAAL